MRPVTSTYRLQLHAGNTFADVAEAVPFLAELGISHLYLSPVLQAPAGSSHGYDTVDVETISKELGGAEGLSRLCRVAHGRGMGVVVDIVPNHLAIGDRANRWWWEVLADGAHAPHAGFFDIDWHAPSRGGAARSCLPVLDDHYGRALERGAIRVVPDDAELFVVAVGDDLVLPLSAAHRRRDPAVGGSPSGRRRASRSPVPHAHRPRRSRRAHRRQGGSPTLACRHRPGHRSAAASLIPTASPAPRCWPSWRAIRSRWTPCSTRRPTGSPAGRSRPTSSTTDASWTSTRWSPCGPRTPRCSTPPIASSADWCGTARSTGCGSITSTAWPTRPGTAPGSEPWHPGRGSEWRRSSPRGSACRRGPSMGRPGTTSPRSTTPFLVDPRGEDRLTKAYQEVTGDERTWDDHAVAAKDRGPPHPPGQRRRPAGRAAGADLRAPAPRARLHPCRAARRAGRGGVAHHRLPVVHALDDRRTGRAHARRPRLRQSVGALGARGPPGARSGPVRAPAPGPRLRRRRRGGAGAGGAVPAADRLDDRQGRGGHCAVPGLSAARPRRGRSRSVALLRVTRRGAPVGRAHGRGVAPDHAHDLDPRHEALRGRPGPPRSAGRGARRPGRRGGPRAGAGGIRARTGRSHRVVRSADGRRRVAGTEGAAVAGAPEVVPRGQAPHELAASGPGLRGCRCPGCWTTSWASRR